MGGGRRRGGGERRGEERTTTTVYSTGASDPAHGAAPWTPRHRHAGPRFRRTLPVQWAASGEVQPHREKRIRWCVPPPAPAGAALPPDAAGPTGTDGVGPTRLMDFRKKILSFPGGFMSRRPAVVVFLRDARHHDARALRHSGEVRRNKMTGRRGPVGPAVAPWSTGHWAGVKHVSRGGGGHAAGRESDGTGD